MSLIMANAALRSENAKLLKENADLDKQSVELQGDNAKLTEENVKIKRELNNTIRELNDTIMVMTGNLDAVCEKNANLETELAMICKESNEVQEENAQLKKELATIRIVDGLDAIRNLDIKKELAPMNNQRFTVVEALQSVIDNSALAKVYGQGKHPFSEKDVKEWPAAVAQDVAAVNNLAQTIVRDLNKFLAIRNRSIVLDNKFVLTIDWIKCGNDYQRCATFYTEFLRTASEFIHNLIRGLHAKSKYKWQNGYNEIEMHDMPFPISWFIRNGDTADFDWANYPKLVNHHTMIRTSFVDPDVFHGYVSHTACELLQVAKTTELDFQPKIMDGVTVYGSMYSKSQALILQPGHDVMIDYWLEPHTDADKVALAKNHWTNQGWEEFTGCVVCFLIFGCVEALFSWWVEGSQWVWYIIPALFGFLTVVLGVGSAVNLCVALSKYDKTLRM